VAAIGKARQECSQVGRAVDSCLVHAPHVEVLVRMRDDVSKACRTDQPIGKSAVDDA
jgi:hypothetical protein